MSKSKETLFDEIVGRHHRELSPLNYRLVSEFADQYSLETAIAFAEWIIKRRLQINLESGSLIDIKKRPPVRYATTELYTQFIESQQQNK